MGAAARRGPRPGLGRRPGLLIYRGAISINLSRFFAWTGGFLILVAAGVLSYGVHDLQEAGILPGLNSVAFDVSATIDPGTWYATLLKGVFNFSPVTTHLEAAAWLLYAVPTMALFVLGVVVGVAGRGRPLPCRPSRSRQRRPLSATDRHPPTHHEGTPPDASSPARGRPRGRPGPGGLHPEHHRHHGDRGRPHHHGQLHRRRVRRLENEGALGQAQPSTSPTTARR
nr:FTR1 family protein [Nocardioides ungokensis]